MTKGEGVPITTAWLLAGVKQVSLDADTKVIEVQAAPAMVNVSVPVNPAPLIEISVPPAIEPIGGEI